MWDWAAGLAPLGIYEFHFPFSDAFRFDFRHTRARNSMARSRGFGALAMLRYYVWCDGSGARKLSRFCCIFVIFM